MTWVPSAEKHAWGVEGDKQREGGEGKRMRRGNLEEVGHDQNVPTCTKARFWALLRVYPQGNFELGDHEARLLRRSMQPTRYHLKIGGTFRESTRAVRLLVGLMLMVVVVLVAVVAVVVAVVEGVAWMNRENLMAKGQAASLGSLGQGHFELMISVHFLLPDSSWALVRVWCYVTGLHRPPLRLHLQTRTRTSWVNHLHLHHRHLAHHYLAVCRVE